MCVCVCVCALCYTDLERESLCRGTTMAMPISIESIEALLRLKLKERVAPIHAVEIGRSSAARERHHRGQLPQDAGQPRRHPVPGGRDDHLPQVRPHERRQ